MTKPIETRQIENTAGQVAAELAPRGMAPDQRVTVLLEPEPPEDWLTKARRFSRPKALAEGLSDDDIDAAIKQAQREVDLGFNFEFSTMR